MGRTARGGSSGVAISFVTPGDEHLVKTVTEGLKGIPPPLLPLFSKKINTKIPIEKGQSITPYTFKMALVEGFRYRVEDTLRGVTRAHVRDARIAEIKAEILNSKKLKVLFYMPM